MGRIYRISETNWARANKLASSSLSVGWLTAERKNTLMCYDTLKCFRKMAKNRIKDARFKHNLSQKQLAVAVGTSQQQIQRIEAGAQTTRLDLALSLSKVLGEPLEKLFPAAKGALRNFRREKDKSTDPDDEELSSKFAEAGIDVDPRIWTLKYQLRGGMTGFHTISGIEKRRLWSRIQNCEEHAPFVVFDTTVEVVAINLKHLIFCQFLFDPPFSIKSEKKIEKLKVYTSCSSEALQFGIEPDDYVVDEDHEPDDSTQFQNLLFTLETYCEPNELIHFFDEDGEYAFFRVHDIAMLTAPLWSVNPTLHYSEPDPLEENDLSTEDDREE